MTIIYAHFTVRIETEEDTGLLPIARNAIADCLNHFDKNMQGKWNGVHPWNMMVGDSYDLRPTPGEEPILTIRISDKPTPEPITGFCIPSMPDLPDMAIASRFYHVPELPELPKMPEIDAMHRAFLDRDPPSYNAFADAVQRLRDHTKPIRINAPTNPVAEHIANLISDPNAPRITIDLGKAPWPAPPPTTNGDTAMPNHPDAPTATESHPFIQWLGRLYDRLFPAVLIVLGFFAVLALGNWLYPDIIDSVFVAVCVVATWCAYTGSMLARACTRDSHPDIKARLLTDAEMAKLMASLRDADDVQAEHNAQAEAEISAGVGYGADGEPDYERASTEALIAGLRSYGGTHIAFVTDSERLALAAANRLETMLRNAQATSAEVDEILNSLGPIDHFLKSL